MLTLHMSVNNSTSSRPTSMPIFDYLRRLLREAHSVESKILFVIGSGFPVKIIYCLVFNDDM